MPVGLTTGQCVTACRVVKKLDESEVFLTNVVLIFMFSSLFLHILIFFFFSEVLPLLQFPTGRSPVAKLKAFVHRPVLAVPVGNDRGRDSRGCSARGSWGAVTLL